MRRCPLWGNVVRPWPAARDYGYAAINSLTPMAKRLIQSAYGRGPDRLYALTSTRGTVRWSLLDCHSLSNQEALSRARKNMPHVIVKLWPGKSEEQKRRLADAMCFGNNQKFLEGRPNTQLHRCSRLLSEVWVASLSGVWNQQRTTQAIGTTCPLPAAHHPVEMRCDAST